MTDVTDTLTLTDHGRQYALTAAEHNSTVAQTALTGLANGWPDTHVDSAIRICNESGRAIAAEAAFLATYEGPWGLKASDEDALLSILRVARPEFGQGGSLDIYALRGWERLSGLVDELADLHDRGNDSRTIVKCILAKIDERFSS